MENILLVLNIVFAVILVLLVLMQKSEGGALGIGVSQESYMFSKTAGNFMTKATAINFGTKVRLWSWRLVTD